VGSVDGASLARPWCDGTTVAAVCRWKRCRGALVVVAMRSADDQTAISNAAAAAAMNVQAALPRLAFTWRRTSDASASMSARCSGRADAASHANHRANGRPPGFAPFPSRVVNRASMAPGAHRLGEARGARDARARVAQEYVAHLAVSRTADPERVHESAACETSRSSPRRRWVLVREPDNAGLVG
jgi:hypothetical protein